MRLTIDYGRFRAFSSDLPDNPPLRLLFDAAGRISGVPERPEFTGTSGYRIGIYRTSISEFSQVKCIEGNELRVTPNRVCVLR